MKMQYLVVLVVAFAGLEPVNALRQVSLTDAIDYARQQVGSNRWFYYSGFGVGANRDKSCIFVHDVFLRAGAPLPLGFDCFRANGDRLLANPNSSPFRDHLCWGRCLDFLPGDVIATHNHVGLVTGDRLTTHVNGTYVEENDWGFRSYEPRPHCWRLNVEDYPFCQ